MRSEMHEAGVRILTAKAPVASPTEALEPSAVDAALGDESAPILASHGARREMHRAATPDAARRTIDQPHGGATPASAEAGDGALLRQLSRQLSLLEIQQQQIRRLLEATERRGGRVADAR